MHIGLGPRIIFGQVVNEPAFLGRFHQPNALCHGVKTGNLTQHVLAGIKASNGVSGVVRRVGCEKNRVEIHLEKFLGVLGNDGIRIILKKMLPHHRVIITPGHNIDIQI